MPDMSANQGMSVESLLGQAADEFTQRLGAGERPSIEEYAERYPQIAAVIREVFPALEVMSPPAGSASDAMIQAAAESSAGTLGDYRLIREIGRGGMGVVYEAEQLSLGRPVALKVLSFAAVLDQRQLQRFRNEAQAAAQLHHTNIVPVFSVGCERGVHYYAMQYIEGHPLSAVIAELRRFAGIDSADDLIAEAQRNEALTQTIASWFSSSTTANPTHPAAAEQFGADDASGMFKSLTTAGSTQSRSFFRSIVNMIIQAGEALQHAHDRGVIHRDIKPSNLLLDTTGRLWVTDFGLAVIQTNPALTLTGDLVGTIRYMSPEQAMAKRVGIDHRTDIYSLGATAYELLTLTPVYSGRDRQELLRQIAFDEPRPLRRINPAIPRELETIIAKAMTKNPDERYASARELVADLRRFMEDKPILAKPPTILDRGMKWTRRHRTLVAAGMVLLVLSVAGLAISTVIIAGERAKALHERDLAQEQKQRAETSLQAAQEAVDRMLKRSASLNGVDPPGAEGIRLTLEQDAVRQAQALVDKSGESSARRDLAVAQIRLARTNLQVGNTLSAERSYVDAIQEFERLREEFPETLEYRMELANANVSLGMLMWERRNYSEAEQLARQAQELAAELVKASPLPAHRQTLAASLDLLGQVLRDRNRTAEAESAFEQCVKLRTALVNEALESSAKNEQTLPLTRTQRNLADLLMKTNRREQAERLVREVLATQASLVNWFPSETIYAMELADTRRWWDEVLRLADQRASESPQDSTASAGTSLDEYGRQVAKAQDVLTDAVRVSGMSEEAMAAYAEVVELIERMIRANPEQTRYREDLARMHRTYMAGTRAAWRLNEAASALRKAKAIWEELAEEFPDKQYQRLVADADREMQEIEVRMPAGELILLSKTSPDGVAMAVEIARTADPEKVPANALITRIYAEHLAVGGCFAQAEHYARKSIKLEPRNPAGQKALAWMLLGLGREKEATQACRKGLIMVGVIHPEQAARSCPDPCTLGYMLDMFPVERFIDRWKGVRLFGSRLDPWPWFFVGLRMEFEGKLEEAKAAYRNAENMSRLPNVHHSANWAAYRLQILNGTRVPVDCAPLPAQAP